MDWMTKEEGARVRVQPSPIEGQGLFAVHSIPVGEPLFSRSASDRSEQPGQVIMTEEEFRA
jgi:hypothetical protein